MRNSFVETANVNRFSTALTALERRGAQEACLMVVDGLPGLGKTTALHRWAAQTGAIYVRAKKEWTPSWFLNDLLAQFRITPGHSYQRRYSQALEAMLQQQSSLTLQKRTFAVVIDEADHISRSGRIMESIRDFSDMGDIVFVLVGMGKIRDNLTAFPQVASRIAQYVRFEHATKSDVRAFYDRICEVPVADDVVDFTHSVTAGFNREIKEALATVERFGRRNGAAEGKPVQLGHLSGQVLVNDRRTGAPIVVPGGL
ncbi:AAA family ATPase [Phreatobacter stygius]|uniref:ATP-binding protein n=1 Tax=Phreatobacter stygius TaxID=1940610 RepID=A0A4D7BC92_9HYPH|nr:ATP-binding protein [Phreatobacter stygius]QCI65662.1 ATP-binding protein [Phreatobacter stygius]